VEKMVFINLPVRDLTHSIAFYEAVGAVKDPAFTDDTAAMMRFSDAICVMVLTHERYASFTKRSIPNAHESAQMLIAINEEDRAAVDDVVARAAKAGGTADPNPPQDHGFMYSRSFADPDGHIWEPFWMDMSAVPPA